MNNIIPTTNIENMIFEIRGKQVMLDRDLAYLYEAETRILNQRVKRNKERFPESFCFQMSNAEFKIWTSQIVMSDRDKKRITTSSICFYRTRSSNAISNYQK